MLLMGKLWCGVFFRPLLLALFVLSLRLYYLLMEIVIIVIVQHYTTALLLRYYNMYFGLDTVVLSFSNKNLIGPRD